MGQVSLPCVWTGWKETPEGQMIVTSELARFHSHCVGCCCQSFPWLNWSRAYCSLMDSNTICHGASSRQFRRSTYGARGSSTTFDCSVTQSSQETTPFCWMKYRPTQRSDLALSPSNRSDWRGATIGLADRQL